MKPTLTELIRTNYGSQKQCAQQLGVCEHTIVRWLQRTPEMFFRHWQRIAETSKIDIADFARAVIDQRNEINETVE